MKLENQVVSLELAKELKELGYPQESLFYWSTILSKEWSLKRYDELNVVVEESEGWTYLEEGIGRGEVVAAPTVAELGQELAMVEHEKVLEAYGYVVGAIGTQVITPTGLVMAMHRPDMGAKMLIYLLKNKLIELK